MVLHLKKLESPSPKDALCKDCLKLAQWFWRRGFFNLDNVFFAISYYLPLEKGRALFWTNLNPLHPRMHCAKIVWNWLSGSGEEDFIFSTMYFSLFRNYLPLEKGGALHLNKLESPSPKDALCQVWLKITQWFWRRIFFMSSMYFHYFVIISPWKRAGPFIWRNLNPLHPRMLCAKFGWNWLSGSGEEDFLVSSMYFHYFVIISPWRRTGPFIWTNLNALYPRMLCAKFGWNWPGGSGEEDENVKSLQTDGRTDRQTDRRKVIRKANLSFQLWLLQTDFWFP